MSKKLETELYKAATLTFEELGFLLPTPGNRRTTVERPS